MGLRIIAYPAFRDAAGGDGFAADCLVSQAYRFFRARPLRQTHQRTAVTDTVPIINTPPHLALAVAVEVSDLP